MSVFNNRCLLVIALVVIAAGASAVIWGVPRVFKRSTSVKSQVNAYLLDDRGSVSGLLLASGDQLHFSPETGTVVASQIKVGDEVSATGHAGSQTNYGREIRVEKIESNGRTILEVHSGPPRKHGPDHGPRGGDDHDRGPGPRDPGPTLNTPNSTEATPTQVPSPDAKQTQSASPVPSPVPVPTPETVKVTGTIKAHLVNGHGDVAGLILSSGEQVRFSPKVGKLVTAAEQGSTTQVSVDGTVTRNERGIVIRPSFITVGNQTITMTR